MNETEKNICYFVLIITIIISVVARIMSTGAIFLLTIGIFLIHICVFICSNIITIKKSDKFEFSGFATVLFFISCISLMVAYITMPDYGGKNVAFFGTEINEFSSLLNISIVFIIINIITIIFEFNLPYLKKRKNRKTDNNSENNTDKDINIKED